MVVIYLANCTQLMNVIYEFVGKHHFMYTCGKTNRLIAMTCNITCDDTVLLKA
jgi:hypothetical protein